LGLSQQAKCPRRSKSSAGISRKWVLVCCACYVVVFIRKRLFLSLSAFCLRRIFAAQSGQYFARLLPAANVLPHTAQRFKSVSPLRVICSHSCLSAGKTASRK